MEPANPTLEKRYKEFKGIFFILLASTVVVALNVFLLNASNEQDNEEPEAQVVSEVVAKTESSSEEPSYPLSEVAKHNTATDCWMAAYGKVYDVTAYVSSQDHPGGQKTLISGCGTEATATFDRIHSPQAKADLETLRIGKLE